MKTNSTGANRVSQWFQQRQLRVLDHAYTAAREIRALEEQYCEGNPILYSPEKNKTVFDYVRSMRDLKLLQVRTHLIQFRVNTFLLNRAPNSTADTEEMLDTQEQAVLNQLNFIESVISKYRNLPEDELARDASLMEAKESKRGRVESPKPTSGKSSKATAAAVVDPPIIEVESDWRQPHKLSFWGGELVRSSTGRRL